MKSLHFTVAGRLAGLNEILDARILAGRRRSRTAKVWNSYSELKKAEQERVWLAMVVGGIPRPKPGEAIFQRIWVHFTWIEPDRRRDPDNIRAGAKFILDAMRDWGIVPNDSQKHVRGLEDAFMVDAEARISVDIEGE